MKLELAMLPFVFLFILGCKQQVKQGGMEAKLDMTIDTLKQTSTSLNNWVTVINKRDIAEISKLYSSDAYSIVSGERTIPTSDQIANYYSAQDSKINSIESLFKIEANTNRGIHYELVKYSTDRSQIYTQLIIWRGSDDKVIREFEFTEAYSKLAHNVDTSAIGDRRRLWIERCNAHNAENLVKELYTSNTIYFNHKPLVIGTEAVVKEYGYMNSDQYSLHLEPIIVEVVNEKTVLEIGQCSGSYGGKYILIWKKQADDQWKIHIDSNI